jgi:hypothetical protein
VSVLGGFGYDGRSHGSTRRLCSSQRRGLYVLRPSNHPARAAQTKDTLTLNALRESVSFLWRRRALHTAYAALLTDEETSASNEVNEPMQERL